MLSDRTVIFDEIVFQFTFLIYHDKEIVSYCDVNNWCLLLFIMRELADLFDLIFNLMKEYLTIC